MRDFSILFRSLILSLSAQFIGLALFWGWIFYKALMFRNANRLMDTKLSYIIDKYNIVPQNFYILSHVLPGFLVILISTGIYFFANDLHNKKILRFSTVILFNLIFLLTLFIITYQLLIGDIYELHLI